MKKICSKCNIEKDLSEFSPQISGKFGVTSICKPCRSNKHKEYRNLNSDKVKNSHLKRTFGITLDQYKQMEQKQNGICAICGNKETILDYRTNNKCDLVVDHNHQTGKVRGLLCSKCNKAFGLFQENIDNFKSAIDYKIKYL